MISDAGPDLAIVGVTDVFAGVWQSSISKFTGLGMFRQTPKKNTASLLLLLAPFGQGEGEGETCVNFFLLNWCIRIE